MENGSLLGKAKSGWNAFIFQEKFASTPCAARKIELTATRAKKNASFRRKRRDLGEKKRDFGKLERKRREIRPLILAPK